MQRRTRKKVARQSPPPYDMCGLRTATTTDVWRHCCRTVQRSLHGPVAVVKRQTSPVRHQRCCRMALPPHADEVASHGTARPRPRCAARCRPTRHAPACPLVHRCATVRICTCAPPTRSRPPAPPLAMSRLSPRRCTKPRRAVCRLHHCERTFARPQQPWALHAVAAGRCRAAPSVPRRAASMLRVACACPCMHVASPALLATSRTPACPSLRARCTTRVNSSSRCCLCEQGQVKP